MGIPNSILNGGRTLYHGSTSLYMMGPRVPAASFFETALTACKDNGAS